MSKELEDMNSVRLDCGGFLNMLREDAEDYLNWLVDLPPVEPDAPNGTSIVALLHRDCTDFEDIQNWLFSKFLISSDGTEIGLHLEDMDFRLPCINRLQEQKVRGRGAYVDDVFVWCAWSERVTNCVDQEKLINICRDCNGGFRLNNVHWAIGNSVSQTYSRIVRAWNGEQVKPEEVAEVRACSVLPDRNLEMT